jgi:hypothetical protein
MTYAITRSARALGIAAAVAGLVAMSFLLTRSTPASAGTSVPMLDHFLCYQAKVAGVPAPPNVLLQNALDPNAFAPKFGAASAHCNPANKAIPGAIFLAKDPLAHLLCYTITYKQASQSVALTNQFGKAIMTVGSPGHFCLPAWKSNVAPPNMSIAQPPGLDHFTCYALTAVASTYGFKTGSVKAEDEFNAPNYTALKMGEANSLCVPTTKIVAGVVYPPQTANDLSLVCFPTQPTPFWKTVFDQTQFGESVVHPLADLEHLCVPSAMVIQKPTAG